MAVVRLTEENTRLRSQRDNAVQVRERALADATRLWQLVDRLGGDSPRETQNMIPSPTSKGQRINGITCMKSPANPPPPNRANTKTVMRSAAAVYTFACRDSWKGGARKSRVVVTGIMLVRH